MGLIVFFLLVGLFLLVILPIMAFTKVKNLEEEQNVRFASLESKVRRLEESIGKGKKIEFHADEEVQKPVQVKKVTATPPPLTQREEKHEKPIEAKVIPVIKEEKVEIPKQRKTLVQPKSPTSEWTKRWEEFAKTVDWEQFTGVKLFAWLGGVALFCGAAFFVKYSIDRNLIPPALRLSIGALMGLGLIVWSLRIDRKKYETTSHILSAGGVGVLYTVIFAATHMYHYLPNTVGLVLLALTSFSAFILSVFLNGVSISALGALGAYGAPLLLSTGEGSLVALFLYLSVVNIGLYKVVERLKSPGLFMLSAIGTLVVLCLGTWGPRIGLDADLITIVALANLALFSYFLFRLEKLFARDVTVSRAGYLLFLSVPLTALILLGSEGLNPLILVTGGILLATALSFKSEAWSPAVIPYNALTFLVAVFWVIFRFESNGNPWGFLWMFLYGTAGGLSPLVLVRRWGLKNFSLRWFRIFPLVSLGLTLILIIKNPDASFWFWPMALGLHLLGMFLCLLVGGLLEVGILAVLTLINGLLWVTHFTFLPLDLDFYLVLLIAGGLLCLAVVFLLSFLPGIIAKPAWKPFEKSFGSVEEKYLQWMPVLPALGAFLLLGASFLCQTPLKPDLGMVTGICFLAISLTLGKRASSQPLIVTVLLASAFSEICWMLRVLPGDALNQEVFIWSSLHWIMALLIPFIFFKPAQKIPKAWAAFALYELFQTIFFLRATDTLWARDIMGWIPLGLFMLKLPAIRSLLTSLKGLKERNEILAFQGGVLLFYVSAAPYYLLDHGWLGLTLVLESMALLWLNRRVEHPGLPWVSAFLAPIGLALLVFNLDILKSPGSMPVLNGAVGSIAIATLALVFSVRFAPKPAKPGNPSKEYFLWLSIATGFFLLNLIVADLFGGPQGSFQFLSEGNLLHYMVYSLLWALFGAALWRVESLPKAMKIVGIILLVVGWARMMIWPFQFTEAVCLMPPFLNLAFVFYTLLMILLGVLVWRHWEEKGLFTVKSLFLTLLGLLGFIAFNQELGTFLDHGQPFHLFTDQPPTMALVTAFVWALYGIGTFMWPRGLEKPFRLAGIALVLLGLLKAVLLPESYPNIYGYLTSVINLPNALFFILIGALIYMTLKDHGERWPIEGKVTSRRFWGVTLGLFSFFVLNLEVVELFGPGTRSFSYATYGSLSQQLAYSLSWLLYAMVLLWVGIRWQSVRTRWASLGLLVVTSFKIFFQDLWSMGQLYRVASFIGLAVVLILVSFLYQRYLSGGRKK